MKRKLALVCLVALSVSAGCTSLVDDGVGSDLGLGLGGGGDDTTVNYNWTTSADATLTIEAKQYRSVYKLDTKQLKLYTHGSLGREQALGVRGVKYRYPNGTIITTEHPDLSVEKSGDRTIVRAPKADGRIAFVTDKRSKSISTPVFLKSDNKKPSYEVILPPNTGVDVPIVGTVKPSGFETSTIDGRVHIVWDSVKSNSVNVQYYLTRDLYIFGSIAGLVVVCGLIGMSYYMLAIRRLKRLRQQIETDLDTGNDHR